MSIEPTRMCVTCRGRFPQKSLIRVQCKEKEVVDFSGIGRSFYLCRACILEKKSGEMVSRICGLPKSEKTKIIDQLKEIVFNAQN